MTDSLQRFGAVMGIALALVLFGAAKDLLSKARLPQLPPTGAANSGAAYTPSRSAGPREAKLDTIIADCQRRGILGQAVLADSAVQSAITKARVTCHNNDLTFGQGNEDNDLEASRALRQVYTEISVVLLRMTQNLRESTPR